MRPIQRAGGSVLASKRPYPIAAATAISAGQLVKMKNGFVTACVQNETEAILGIAAETHSGTADALNMRANGTEIMVWDSPDLIFECAAPVITAGGGTATTVTAGSGSLGSFAADAFNGGLLKLKSKAAGSGNTDVPGTVRLIEDFADGTFTVSAGGSAAEGDVYELYPPLGFAKGALDESGMSCVVTGAGDLPIKTVGYDPERGTVRYAAGAHFFGAGE